MASVIVASYWEVLGLASSVAAMVVAVFVVVLSGIGRLSRSRVMTGQVLSDAR